MVSLGQSTRVKFVMLWPSSKPDVRVPDQKENIALLKKIVLKKLAGRCKRRTEALGIEAIYFESFNLWRKLKYVLFFRLSQTKALIWPTLTPSI